VARRGRPLARRPLPRGAHAAGPGGARDPDGDHASPRQRAGRAAGRPRRGNALGGAHTHMTADPMPLSPEEASGHAAAARRLVEALEGVVLGQPAAVRETVAALLARGHVLLEGVPGTAKTLLVRALGLALGLEFR